MQIADYSIAERQVETLSRIAGELPGKSSQLDMIISNLRSVWIGETSDAYLSKLEALNQALRAEAGACQEAANYFYARIIEMKAAALEGLSDSESPLESFALDGA